MTGRCLLTSTFQIYIKFPSFWYIMCLVPKMPNCFDLPHGLLVSDELTADLSVFNLFLAQWIMAIYCQNDVNQMTLNHRTVKLSFTNIPSLCSNFVECESFLESNSPDIDALCETNLDDSIDSGNFFVRDYLPLIRKDSITHMHGLAVYVKKGFHFTQCLFLLAGFTSLSAFSSIDHLLHHNALFLILFRLT